MIDDEERPDQENAPEGNGEDTPPEEAVEEVGSMGAETVPDAGEDEATSAASGEDAKASAEETPAENEEAPTADDAPATEVAADSPPAEEPVAEEPPAADPPSAEEPTAEEQPPVAEEPTEEPAAAEQPTAEAPGDALPAPGRPPRPASEETQEKTADVVPGADLEPDLVLDGEATGIAGDAYADPYAEPDAEATTHAEAVEGEEAPAPVVATPLDLAADARYRATGKRKTSVARVILKPGPGNYTINGRTLEAFFPRPTLQRTARLPLEAAGYETRMDVIARIHGGGVSSQAGALRHGVARALVEADPNLRSELKRRGFLTRDARAKERKKAGLKKARKRPQFSKR